LYISYGVLGGIGTGIIYVGVIGLVVRWFPDHRGLAAGLAAAGYGFGAIFTTFPITSLIQSIGYQQTLLIFGIVQGLIGLVAAQGLSVPEAAVRELFNSVRVVTVQSQVSRTPREMLKNPIFWVLFVMMSLLSTSGLMVTSEVGPFATDFGVSNALVFGLAALPLSLTLSRFTNGLTRPFFGWISDRIGRENTMLIAFMLEAAAIALLLIFRQNAVVFVLLTGLVFFGWGEIFSLFPTLLTDVFGTKYATTNYGFLYIAQGIGSLLGGPAAAYLESVTGSWIPVFTLVACLDVVTALMAVLVLRPMCSRWFSKNVVGESSVLVPAAE
jgi:oxalate/formate antiporter